MSLSVNVYIINDAGKMEVQEPKDTSETLAGSEAYRTKLYGSDPAKSLGLNLLPTLAVQDIYAQGAEVNRLKAEVEIVLNHAAILAEQTGLQESDIRQRAENIRTVCIRARRMQANVIIW